jgi:uncharacterized protein YraI
VTADLLCTVIVSSLNLRYGPGTIYPPKRSLSQGEELRARGRAQENDQVSTWIVGEVVATGMDGWVNAATEYVACTFDIHTLSVVPAPPLPTPTSTPQTAIVVVIGLWEYGKDRPPMPGPAGAGQVIVANGDIDNSGTCHVEVFGPGETVQGLGEGTFKLVRVSGTPEQVQDAVAEIQRGAAAHAGGACPFLTSTASAIIEEIGLWEYGGSRPPMPDPAVAGQVVVANGDIDNSGTCHVKVFGPGETVQGLGEGTFELARVTGTPKQIQEAIDEIQRGAAAHAGGACPFLASTASAIIEEIGLWEYGQERPPMPDPAGADQVVVAHGDIDNSGTCHVKVFGPGETVQGLGEGTFKLVRVSGTPEQIERALTDIQAGAAIGAADGKCPRL